MIILSAEQQTLLKDILDKNLFQHWNLINQLHEFISNKPNCVLISQEELNRLRQENISLKEFKEDWEDDYRKTVSNSCAPDEKHCSCVPFLRLEIKNLKSKVQD